MVWITDTGSLSVGGSGYGVDPNDLNVDPTDSSYRDLKSSSRKYNEMEGIRTEDPDTTLIKVIFPMVREGGTLMTYVSIFSDRYFVFHLKVVC